MEAHMNNTSINQLVHTYIEGWIAGDREKILSTLDTDYFSCYLTA
ncbi:hypothetical protein KDW_53710 [Dictyobacter vulcani]|uniref:SnoaL-like domain-containing protein n=1 Tax=Dictyobacter vulcani TaxID=2607529 RepID=A0A5J4KYH8_9CHLR|nr:hypothetical protein KDW_53710 [Dictyobacter vulcani]